MYPSSREVSQIGPALTAGNHYIRHFGPLCRFFTIIRIGKSRATMKRMKKKESEGIRTYSPAPLKNKGVGPGSAGQSGDTQGLSDVEEADSESVEELIEEGQSFEAQVIKSVEDAPDPDVAEVHTKEVPEDDVPDEYLDRDRPV
jgi:hypothetical protein